MKRFFYGFIAFIFLFLSIYPFSYVFADDLVVTGTPIPVQGDLTDEQLKDILVAGITADLVSQGYEIDLSASDGDWDNFKNSILDVIFNRAASGSGFIGEIYNSALYHNLIDEDFTIWYPDTSEDSYLPGISKRSIYRNLSDGLISDLTENRSDNASPTPTPDPVPVDYAQYIEIINGQGFDNWFNYVNVITYGVNITPRNWSKNYSFWFYGSSYMSNINYITQKLDWNNCCASDIYDIYIYSNNGQYSYNIVLPSLYNLFIRYNYNNYYTDGHGYTYQGRFTYKSDGANISAPSWSHNFNSLELLFKHLSACVHNVNIYVDGVPWSIVDDTPQVLPTVVINPGYVLQGTDYPLVYNFPEPPYFDYQRMIDIIKHALLQYGVIQWEDIADVFVDVNGQTAVAILEIHRNDYDVLYDEQYPGIALPNRFNTHLLDSSHQYLSPVVQTVEETTGILPGEIKGALAIGMMLTIFACLIHRLLE